MKKFERTVLQYIKQQQLVASGDHLLIACSGGVDSMAMVHFFEKMKNHLHIRLSVVHVDHMLRGQQSAEDLQFVKAFCEDHDIPFFGRAINIPSLLHNGGNTQAVCRQERYRYFEEVAQRIQATKLVTAHHADDQLETMLMNLTKSQMASSLQSILAKRIYGDLTLIRPFLMVTKSQIGEYLNEQNIPFREDPSNAKLDYKRNRFRHEVVPHLQQENPQVAAHAVYIAEQLQQDEDFLMSIANSKFQQLFQKSEGNDFEVEIEPFQNEPLALQRRLILILLNYLYSDSNTFLSYALIQEILKQFASIQGSAIVHLPEGFIARRQYHKVIFEKRSKLIALEPTSLRWNEWQQWGHVRLYIGEISEDLPNEKQGALCYYFHSKACHLPFHIRVRQEGDRLQPAGMSSRKKVSRLFIDEKIPSAERDCWPLLVDAQNEVLAVIGVRVNQLIATVKRSTDDCILVVQSVD